MGTVNVIYYNIALAFQMCGSSPLQDCTQETQINYNNPSPFSSALMAINDHTLQHYSPSASDEKCSTLMAINGHHAEGREVGGGQQLFALIPNYAQSAPTATTGINGNKC